MGIYQGGTEHRGLIAVSWWCSQAMGNLWSASLAAVWGDSDKVSGYIYRVKGVSGKIYIGSTTEEDLNRRLRVHEAAFRSWKRGKSGYCSVFEILEEGGYDIELLETVKSDDKKAVRTREGYYYRLFGDTVVNMRAPHRHPWECKRQRAKAMRGHYARNRDLINGRNRNRNSEKVKCDICDCWISRGYKANHERTWKHQDNLILNNQ